MAARPNRGPRAGLAADEVWPGWPVQVDRNRGGLVLLALELLDGAGRRCRGVAGGGRDLSGQLRADVAGRVQTGETGLHRRVGHEEPKWIVLQVDAMIEKLHVRLEADEDEDPGDRQRPGQPRHHVFQGDLLHLALFTFDFGHDGIGDQLDLRILARRFHQNGLGAKLLAPVDDVDLARVARQEDALLQGGVTATYHRDHLFLEEGAVTDSALGHAAALELTLAGDAQFLRLAASRQDYEFGHILAVLRLDDFLTAFLPDDGAPGRLQVDADFERLVSHALRQLGTRDVIETGVVFDRLGIEQLTTRSAPLEKHGLDPRPAGVKRRGEAGRPTADVHDVVSPSLVTRLAISHVSYARSLLQNSQYWGGVTGDR